jgi:hypothetical protein
MDSTAPNDLMTGRMLAGGRNLQFNVDFTPHKGLGGAVVKPQPSCVAPLCYFECQNTILELLLK